MFETALVIMRDKQAYLTLVWYARNQRDNNIYAFTDDGLLVSEWRFHYDAVRELPTRERAMRSMEHHIKQGDYPLCPFTREEILLVGLDS